MNKQTKILAGVLAAVVLLSAGVLVWRKLNPQEARIAKLQRDLTQETERSITVLLEGGCQDYAE